MNHIIVDAYDISEETFKKISNENYEIFNQFVLEKIKKHNVNVISYSMKDFENPVGAFTSLYLLSESHLSFHSWPELNYIAIDCFTCGNCNTLELANDILSFLTPVRTEIKQIVRGEKTTQNG